MLEAAACPRHYAAPFCSLLGGSFGVQRALAADCAQAWEARRAATPLVTYLMLPVRPELL